MISLAVATCIVCASALAAPDAPRAEAGMCTPVRDGDCRMLRVAEGAAPGRFAGGPLAVAQRSAATPVIVESVALRKDAPGPTPGAVRGANDLQKAQWLRMADVGAVPEPGLWALLLAGFLGICALARPRIFSS
jgi:hypothetical protein